jgi:transcriptional regulator with XRE-family HTH domain
MPKSAFTDAYASVIEILVALRHEKGVSQVELAKRLGKTQQFVSKVERLDRRIDVIEFYAICRALGADPADAFQHVLDALPAELSI